VTGPLLPENSDVAFMPLSVRESGPAAQAAWADGVGYETVQHIVDLGRERDDLRQVGDYIQSEASRLAEWAAQQCDDMPYEVYQAWLGVQHGVRRWTEVRKGAHA
jgi:hypothetical protein